MFSGFSEIKTADTFAVPEYSESEHLEANGVVRGFRLAAITRVIVDVHAALRIVKHARDSGTRAVSGTLHGIQVGATAEVTAAVPILPVIVDRFDEETNARELEAENHSKTLDVLTKRCRIDPSRLGKYVCCAHSQHVSYRQLHPLDEAIRQGEPALLLVYDPLRSAMGKLFLKAYVPSEQYTKLVRDNLGFEEAKNTMLLSDILVESAVELHANPLQQLLLYQLAQKPRSVKNLLVSEHELGRYTERALFNLSDGLQQLKDGIMFAKKRQAQDAEPGTNPALKSEMHLTAQRLRQQAQHVNALAAGSAQVLDFARRLPQS